MPTLLEFYLNQAKHGPDEDRQGNLILALEELARAVKELESKLDQHAGSSVSPSGIEKGL